MLSFMYYGVLTNNNVTHVDGSINPIRDKEIIDTELQLKDLETVEGRIAESSKTGSIRG